MADPIWTLEFRPGCFIIPTVTMRGFCNKPEICTALARIGVLSYSHSKGNIPHDHNKRRDKNGEYKKNNTRKAARGIYGRRNGDEPDVG